MRCRFTSSPAVVQRHQQHVTTLAQVVRAAVLGDQVGVARIGTAGVAPQAIGILERLPAGAGAARLRAVGGPARCAGASIRPPAGRPASGCSRCASVPAFQLPNSPRRYRRGTAHTSRFAMPALVARDVEAVNLPSGIGQPVQRAKGALQGVTKQNHGISHGSTSRVNRPTTAASASNSTASG